VSARSYLYVPGDQPEKLVKSVAQQADAVIADLEDAVSLSNKQRARETVKSWLSNATSTVWIRINNTDQMQADLEAIAGTTIAGIVLPKATVSSVERAARAGFPICALIETAEGVLDARAIASARPVVRLMIGEVDLSAELGIELSHDGRELAAARLQVVLASAAAGIDQPVAPISRDFKDLEGLRTSTLALKRAGFGARSAIHPAQLDTINSTFTPNDEEIARARTLLAAFDAAGRGVGVDDDGRMIDEAVVRAARRILELAGD
jgi:citrate lyase subunit beta / citryl-CoA lyase